MPTAALGSVAELTAVRMPLDGELGSAADLQALAIQPLCNRDAYRNQQIAGVGLFVAGYTSMWFEVDVSSAFVAAGWTDGDGNQIPYWTQSATGTLPLKFNISPIVPCACWLTRFSVTIIGAPGHTVFPATPPYAQLVRYPRLGDDFSGSPEIIATANLPTGLTISAYNSKGVTLMADLFSHQYDDDYIYMVYMYGENGADSETGLVVRAVNFQVGNGL